MINQHNTNIMTATWPWISFSVKFFSGILGVFAFLLYYNQDRILYIPNPTGYPKTVKENPEFWRNPGEWTVKGHPKRASSTSAGIPYEDVTISTEDGEKLHGWLMLQPRVSNEVPTLVYFHGNAGNMGFRLKNAAEMYAKTGINVFMVDYRGYGSSTGTPNEVGLNKDADAVLHYLTHNKMIKGSPIVLFGRSLGGAVAISLAHRYPKDIQGLILENTFVSISSMVDILLPYVRHLKPILLRLKWDSGHKIQSLTQPMLFISGDSDELVPPNQMKKLYDLATKSSYKDFYSVLGGHHNDTWEIAGSAYYMRLVDFFTKITELFAGEKRNTERLRDMKDQTVNEMDKQEQQEQQPMKSSIPTMNTKLTVNVNSVNE